MTLDSAQLYETFDTDASPAVEFIQWLVERRGVRSPPTVLDVGCGPGRLIVPLSALGCRLIGLEPDPDYRARAEHIAEAVGATVREGGFTDIEGSAEYDLILGINSSFAHLLTPDERAEAFRRCRHALREDGLLILDLPNLLRILREYREPEERHAVVNGRAITLSRRHTLDYRAATFTTHERYVVEEVDGTRWSTDADHVYSIVALPELEYLLAQAGFGRIELFESLADRRGGHIGTRLVIVAAVA